LQFVVCSLTVASISFSFALSWPSFSAFSAGLCIFLHCNRVDVHAKLIAINYAKFCILVAAFAACVPLGELVRGGI